MNTIKERAIGTKMRVLYDLREIMRDVNHSENVLIVLAHGQIVRSTVCIPTNDIYKSIFILVFYIFSYSVF
jgi:hypothetical protein